MKTLAVIKNELFKDFLRIVSTDDLAKTLDNPDVPLPYECLDSVDNNNSDMLATQLAQYFNQSKLPNKDFYRLDEDQTSQLSFMLDLIKVSSGGAPAKSGLVRVGRLPENAQLNIDVEEENNTMPSEEFATQGAPVLEENLPEAHFEEENEEVVSHKNALRRIPEEILTEEVKSEPVITLENPSQNVNEEVPSASSYNPLAIDSSSVSIANPSSEPAEVEPIEVLGIPNSEDPVEPVATNPVEENPAKDIDFNSPVDIFATNSDIQEVSPVDEDDPFKFIPTETAKKEDVAPVEPEVAQVESEVETTQSVAPTQESDSSDNEVIASFGIPKNSILHLVKNNAMTATLIDDTNVIFEGNTMTLGEAAKAALKKSGVLGIPNGLSGWSFEGKTLKELKDSNA